MRIWDIFFVLGLAVPLAPALNRFSTGPFSTMALFTTRLSTDRLLLFSAFAMALRSVCGYEARGLARQERQVLHGLRGLAALDGADDLAHLLGRHAGVSGKGLYFHGGVPPQISLRVMPPCALKMRVRANSPSLWPTMFSVT